MFFRYAQEYDLEGPVARNAIETVRTAVPEALYPRTPLTVMNAVKKRKFELDLLFVEQYPAVVHPDFNTQRVYLTEVAVRFDHQHATRFDKYEINKDKWIKHIDDAMGHPPIGVNRELVFLAIASTFDEDALAFMAHFKKVPIYGMRVNLFVGADFETVHIGNQSHEIKKITVRAMDGYMDTGVYSLSARPSLRPKLPTFESLVKKLGLQALYQS